HPVLNCIAGCQDQDGDAKTRLAQFGQDFKAWAAWQHQVQDDAIERLRRRHAAASVPIVGNSNLIALCAQTAFQTAQNLAVILDYKAWWCGGHGRSKGVVPVLKLLSNPDGPAGNGKGR